MAYGRRSSLLMFLTGALIMLGSLGAVATIVGSRPASAGAVHAVLPSGCPECATVTGVQTVILEAPGNPLTARTTPAAAAREYHVTVRHDDGTTRTISQPQNLWRAGDRVRLIGGRLQAINAG